MRKKQGQFFFFLLLLAFLCLPKAQAASGSDDKLVLVGLAYGSSALDGANLKNVTGTGYRFGYLDDNRNFLSVGSTHQTAISIVKTQNVYYGSVNNYTSYSTSITSSVGVGCWHVQMPLSPKNATEAQTFADSVDGFPAWINGTYQVRKGSYTTQEKAEAAAAQIVGATAVGTSSYGVSVVKTGTSQIVFQFDGGKNRSLFVQPGQNDAIKASTWFKNSQYYGGFQYRRINGGSLTVSNGVPLEDYINCVISREMSRSWPLEALKAQAVCARTYYETNLGRHTTYGFDICATTHCQAYYGMSETDSRTAQAASETAGLRAWYDGKPAQTYYFATSGGGTEDVRNVWGSTKIPYLCGVVDPYEATVSSQIPEWRWTRTFTSSELTAKLQSKGYNCSSIVDFRVTELTPTGNVKTITFVDSNGKSWPFTKESGVRTMLGLMSIRYTVNGSGANLGGSSGTTIPAETTSPKPSSSSTPSGSPNPSSGPNSSSNPISSSIPGASSTPAATPTPAPTPTSSTVYYIDGGGTLSSLEDAYAVSGDGAVGTLPDTPYVITGSGTQKLGSTSATAMASPMPTPTDLDTPLVRAVFTSATYVSTPVAASTTDTSRSASRFVVRGSGHGHSVGMSQWGAYAMAKQGKTYRDILLFYYPGIEIK